MRILFLQSIWFEFLGTMSLLGILRQNGISADLAIGNDTALLKSVAAYHPDIVAFSCVTGIQGWALNLCRRIKTEISRDIKTFMGGPHPTFFPEIIEKHSSLDFICIGEGEGALLDFASRFRDPETLRDIPNIYCRTPEGIIKNDVRPLIADLDRLPFMDRDPFYKYPLLKDNPVKRLITGRGCPNSCAFCFNHSAMTLYRNKGRYVRKRSVENVLEEIRLLKDRYPVKTIRFEDDLFGVSKKWLFEFCQEYPKQFSIPFICSMRADAVDDDIAGALAQAGCFNIVIGVESGNEEIRNKLLKKNISDGHLRNAAMLFHKHRLNFCTTNILGLPGETFKQALETVTFNLSLKPTFTWCSVFQPYPRTELGEKVTQDGLVDSLSVDDIEPNYHSKSLLKQKDIGKSVNLHKFFYIVFNHPWTLPLVKQIVKLPSNPLFVLLHRISFLFIYSRRWNISLFRAVKEAVKTTGFTRKVDIESQEVECS